MTGSSPPPERRASISRRVPPARRGSGCERGARTSSCRRSPSRACRSPCSSSTATARAGEAPSAARCGTTRARSRRYPTDTFGSGRRRGRSVGGTMPEHLRQPTRIVAAGNLPKQIDEYIGRVNSKTAAVSVAHMRSPAGWVEPGQTPEFDEYTVVLRGMLRVEHRGGAINVRAGEAVIARRGEWVRYSSPLPEGAEYVAVCVPAFSPDTVHRDS